MKLLFQKFSLILFSLSIFITHSQVEKSGNLNDINKENTISFFPPELLEQYDEYKTLEELENTCSFENLIKSNDEVDVRNNFKKNLCILDAKSLNAILENGWFDFAKEIIQDVYLPQKIDPTTTLYNFYNREENKLHKLNLLFTDLKYESLPINYDLIDKENYVKLKLKLPDASYIAEYVTVYCYKDMFKINAIFKSRNKVFKIVDKKYLYDHVVNKCEFNYNTFDYSLDITIEKLNKLKIWEKAFK